MMKPILLAAAALSAASAAEARVAPPLRLVEPAPMPARPSEPDRCTITVAFGSYGPGIDLPTLQRMERHLRVNRGVRGFTRLGRGREGEVTLCIHTRTRRDVEPVVRQLRAMIPARPRGPIRIVRA